MRKKKTPTVLVTAGNLNTKSFRGICYAVREVMGPVDEIYIFDSPESAKQSGSVDRSGLIREIFGSIKITTSDVTDKDIQTIIPDRLSALIQEYGVKNIIVDLTNGQKITASVLYAIATISRIPNICVLESKVRLGPESDLSMMRYPDEWDYVLVEPLQGIKNISRSSFVELVYYRDRIDEVVKGIIGQNYDFSTQAKGQLQHALIEYFSFTGQNSHEEVALAQCVQSLGKICEEAIKYWYQKCINLDLLVMDADSKEARETYRMLQQISKAWTTYRSQAKDFRFKRKSLKNGNLILPNLITDQMLEIMRHLRNYASHPNSPYAIAKHDARMCLDITLLILEKLGEGKVFEVEA